MTKFLLKDTLEAKQFDLKDRVAAKEFLMREKLEPVKINTNVPFVFNPASIPDLEAWFDGRFGITKDGSDNISNWNDVLGNHFAIQSAGVLQPLFFQSPSFFLNTPHVFFNALPELRVDMGVAPEGIQLTDYTMYLIYQTVAANKNRHNAAGRQAPADSIGTHGTGVTVDSRQAGTFELVTTNAHTGAQKVAFQNNKIFFSGVEDTYTTQNSLTAFDLQFIGSAGGTGEAARFRLSQFLIFTRKITAAEIANLDAWALLNFGVA